MVKRRLVIFAVVTEGRPQVDIARTYQDSESTVSRWITHHRTDGDAKLQPRSRRRYTSPARLPTNIVDQIVNLRDELFNAALDAGPANIA